MDKYEIAAVLEEIAVLLEFKRANPFRVRAYQNAARSLLNLDQNLHDVIEEEKLTELEGIGDDLAQKITKLAKTGKLPFYEKLKKSVPAGLLEMKAVHGLGAKKIKIVYDKLGIKSIAALKKACQQGKIAKLRGFGTRTEQNILDSIAHLENYGRRYLWWEAMNTASPILEKLRGVKGVVKAEIAGSLRRKLETVGDLDFIVASSNPNAVMKWFTTQPFVEKITGKGETKSSVRLFGGMQADLRIVPPSQFGYALVYFTGSKEHNIKLRERALRKRWSLSEYSLISLDKQHPSPFANKKKSPEEEDIYKVLGLSYIPPEIRENIGEFAAAEKGKIPELVEEKDIRGTFHNHTTASDGRNTLSEMIAEADKLGWEYIGISDHSKSSFQANGLTEKRLLEQMQQIRKLNASKKYRTYVFSGTECDILPDGSLDFSDKILKQLDFVIVSVHSVLGQDEKTMTKRLIRAIEHPYSTMVGHLTGRLLLRREASAVNVTKVIDACIANHKIIELNSNPQRLDMDWRFWHAASKKGLLCCINTDAHSIENQAFLRAGINMARKGWLEKKHIINTVSLKQIQKLFLERK